MTTNQPPVQNPITTKSGITPPVWIKWFEYITRQIDGTSIDSLTSVVFVKEASDLVNPLSTVLYILDGDINMGNTQIEVPEGGISIGGLSSGRDISILRSSTDNYDMFISPSGGYSGDVVLGNLTVTVDGTNSNVFNLDNDGNSNALDIVNVNFTNCTSLGSLTDYRQILIDIVGFINIDDGLTFNGSWSGISVIDTIAIGFPAATLFKEGTGLSISGSVRSNINFLSVNSSSVLFDFQSSNISSDGGVGLDNVRTIATNAMPNLPSSDVKARYRNCTGIENTYVGGDYAVSSTATTTISSANTLYKMAGTTTYSNMNWFSNSSSNAFTYDSSQPIQVEVEGSLSFNGGNNDVLGVQIRKWDNSASSYVDVGARFTATLNGGAGSRAENVTIFARTSLDENDRIEVWIENQTDTTNITAEVGGFVGVSERPS